MGGGRENEGSYIQSTPSHPLVILFGQVVTRDSATGQQADRGFDSASSAHLSPRKSDAVCGELSLDTQITKLTTLFI